MARTSDAHSRQAYTTAAGREIGLAQPRGYKVRFETGAGPRGELHFSIGSTVQEFIHYVRSAVDRLAWPQESRDSGQIVAGGH